MTTDTIPMPTLSRQDFVSDQTVRWCPGCGDYAILATIQKALPELGIPRENIVFISGIGCSSRFPYYMNTYGIHSIHGRAPTLATGLAIANPDLSIWVVTGDGDGLSIGGNHLLHALRRNVNLNIILFNNRIYGLTKGQYSPTSRVGAKTGSSPMGTFEHPINPIGLALAAEATFVGRSIDAHTQHLGEVLLQAARHHGSSFVEVYQNCVIFNPTEWEGLDDRRTRDDNILYLEHGKPMIFGKNRDRGIRLNGFTPEIVMLGDGVTEADLVVHDTESTELGFILSNMEFPTPMGVFRSVSEHPTYTDSLMAQIAEAQAKRGRGNLDELYRAADLWTVVPQEPNEPIESHISGRMAEELDDEYIDRLQGTGMPTPKTNVQDRLVEHTVSSLAAHAPVEVDAHTSLAKAIRQMNSHNIGCVMVTDENARLIGIFTERDVLMRVAGLVNDLSAATVEGFMTPEPVAVGPDTPIAHALHLMAVHGFRHLPLVDDGHRPVGLISFRDVVHHLHSANVTVP
ncbi:Putative 2-oxoglutarate:ferredoxin oxidoreductase, beta subunit [Candidatus Promineifilum breve]|uniref:2-oxoglutarate:ferredoxin oxidoreductase, beta subunit n=2 Tax=Candidatus Promineifilum breve TaxID=1806508 RepID=A0A160T1I2_9CHLR|nr:Putative 2-oxoglutarate:ferredoxin oxidoreductase, beta subunit [Candidatus Promineifilum breve]